MTGEWYVTLTGEPRKATADPPAADLELLEPDPFAPPFTSLTRVVCPSCGKADAVEAAEEGFGLREAEVPCEACR